MTPLRCCQSGPRSELAVLTGSCFTVRHADDSAAVVVVAIRKDDYHAPVLARRRFEIRRCGGNRIVKGCSDRRGRRRDRYDLRRCNFRSAQRLDHRRLRSDRENGSAVVWFHYLLQKCRCSTLLKLEESLLTDAARYVE